MQNKNKTRACENTSTQKLIIPFTPITLEPLIQQNLIKGQQFINFQAPTTNSNATNIPVD